MQNILDCTPIAQFVIDLDHRITHWNRACEKLTGYSAKRMIGTKDQWMPFYSHERPVLADLIVDDDTRGFETYYKGIPKSEIIPSAWETTGFFNNLGGKERYLYFLAAPLVDSSGNTTGAIETLQDITRRVLSEKNLRESEERYRILTEQVADGVALIQNGGLKVVNRAFVDVFGYASERDLIGKKLIDLVSEKDRSLYRELEKSFDESRFEAKIIEIQCLNASGDDFWVESHNNEIAWQGIPALLVTVRDISRRKRQEQAAEKNAARLKNENLRLRKKIRNRYGLGQLVGKSKPMQAVYENIMKAASSNANVIIYGESGTGKELVARAIYDMSDRGEEAFIAVNCGAIPENLFESEFFGHKKGAFTGAAIDKSGYLESADGGTLFLDEIGEVPLNMQVKLLRAIEGGGFTPIGSSRVKKTDARIIAATNRDLKDLVRKGLVREDFFYRIHIIPIQVPPLRGRKDDIPLLAYHFMQVLKGDAAEGFLSDKILKAMQSYEWPGNVRELQNVIQRYLTFDTLDFMNITEDEATGSHLLEGLDFPAIEKGFSLRDVLAGMERRILQKAIEQEGGNRTRAAKSLGIERRSLQRKLKRHRVT